LKNSFLIETLLLLICIAVYPSFLVYLAILFSQVLGMWSWIVVFVGLCPFVVIAYKVTRKRLLAYQRLLLQKTRVWNITQSIDDYVEFSKKKE